MKHVHFLISATIATLVFWPVCIVDALLVLPIALLTKWDGTTFWFGNIKYSRAKAAVHYKDPTHGVYWREVLWYGVRNPSSNLSRTLLANSQPWAWEYTDYRLGPLTFNFGWKLSPEPGDAQTFKFRVRLAK